MAQLAIGHVYSQPPFPVVRRGIELREPVQVSIGFETILLESEVDFNLCQVEATLAEEDIAGSAHPLS